MTRIALAAAVAVLAPGGASANGRFPNTVDIHFHPTDTQMFLLPTTFGLLLTKDGGSTFQWVCENVVCPGEGGLLGCGTYDPDYAIATDGTIFLTGFEGLYVSHDGACTFDLVAGPTSGKFVDDVEIGPDGTIWVGTDVGGSRNAMYKSTNNGMTFQEANLSSDTGWFWSVKVAPSNAQRIYVTGGQAAPATDGGPPGVVPLLYRSPDGGTSWTPLPIDDFGGRPDVFIIAVSPTDPDVVFARVPDLGVDHLYRSIDGGDNWTKVLSLDNLIDLSDPPSNMVVAGSSDGANWYAGTLKGGGYISTNGGASFTPMSPQPRSNCIGVRSDDTIFSCSTNWDADSEYDPSVVAGLIKSTDGTTWQHVLRFAEITGPLSCPDGTTQKDTCEMEKWPCQADAFGIDWPVPCSNTIVDGGPGDDGGTDPPPKKGCLGCNAAGGAVAAFIVLPLVAFRRRRRRR